MRLIFLGLLFSIVFNKNKFAILVEVRNFRVFKVVKNAGYRFLENKW
jgi:hypothetical protein